MSFAGQIEDFPVTDILQYIHTSQKTGTLVLERDSERSRAHFKNGQIVRVDRPGMTNLGDLLLMKGRLKRKDLRAAIRIQKVASQPRPLGMILEEMGAITHRVLREAVREQIEEVIYDLVTWEEGRFHFELSGQESPDDITVAPDDLIPPEEIDTKLILLEAMRVIQASGGHRPDRRERPQPAPRDSSTPSAAPQLPSSPAPCWPTDLENLSPCLGLLKGMLQEGRDREEPQSVSIQFLKIFSEHLERAILFLVRRGEIVGLGAFGRTRDRRSLNHEIKNLRLGLEPDSLLQKCIESRSPFQGRFGPEPWLSTLHQRIGAPSSPEAMVLPVAGIERVICLVYGDNGDAARPLPRLELLEIAAGVAGIIFENASLHKQLKRRGR